jgi:ribonuclease HI
MMPLPITAHFPAAPVIPTEPSPAEEFAVLQRTLWADRRLLATDGSRAASPDGEVSVGAAVYDAHSTEALLFRLPPLTTVYLAEAFAILQALHHAVLHDVMDPIILTDSLSVLQALRSHRPTASTPEEIVDIRRLLLAMIYDGGHPHLAWVPAHKDIEPNEAADAAANEARVQGAAVQLRLPPTVYYQAQARALRLDWQRDWEQGLVGRHLFGVLPRLPCRPWFASADVDRPVLAATTRLRIGHSRTPAHLHRCAGLASPQCTLCGADSATALHLVEECAFVDRAFFVGHMEAVELAPTLEQVLLHPVRSAPALKALLGANPLLRF